MGPYSTAGLSYFTMIDTQSKHWLDSRFFSLRDYVFEKRGV